MTPPAPSLLSFSQLLLLVLLLLSAATNVGSNVSASSFRRRRMETATPSLNDPQEYQELTKPYQQIAFRTLGVYIDCETKITKDNGCSRFLLWAMYGTKNNISSVTEAWQENIEGESKKWDCGKAESEFDILGIYRQELHAFLETTVENRMWESDEVSASVQGGLDYMTEQTCFLVDNDDNGMYAGVAPQSEDEWIGMIKMELYSDDECIVPLNTNGDDDEKSYASYAPKLDDMNLPFLEEEDDYEYGEYFQMLDEAWTVGQQDNLLMLNDAYLNYETCRSCTEERLLQNLTAIKNDDEYAEIEDQVNWCQELFVVSYRCNGKCYNTATEQQTIFPAINEMTYQDMFGDDGKHGKSTYTSLPTLIVVGVSVVVAMIALIYFGRRLRKKISGANNKVTEMTAYTEVSITANDDNDVFNDE